MGQESNTDHSLNEAMVIAPPLSSESSCSRSSTPSAYHMQKYGVVRVKVSRKRCQANITYLDLHQFGHQFGVVKIPYLMLIYAGIYLIEITVGHG